MNRYPKPEQSGIVWHGRTDNLDARLTQLIGKRRRERRPEYNARLQVLVMMLQTVRDGDGGPDMNLFIKRHVRLMSMVI